MESEEFGNQNQQPPEGPSTHPLARVGCWTCAVVGNSKFLLGSGLGLNFQTLLLSFSIKHQLFRHEEEKNADDTKIEPTRENMTRKKCTQTTAQEIEEIHYWEQK